LAQHPFVVLSYVSLGESPHRQTKGIIMAKTDTYVVRTVLPRCFIQATAADVRTWAGIPLNQRGRLSKDTVRHLHKSHGLGKGRMMYVRGLPNVQTYSVKDADGKTVTVKADPAEIRSWAAENDYEVGERGRLAHETILAFASR